MLQGALSTTHAVPRELATRAASHERTRTTSDLVAFVGTCVLLFGAPFERLQPLVSLPWQKISSLEAPMALALVAWLVALVASGDRSRWKTAVTRPWILWLAAAVAAAVFAPAFRSNALKVSARLSIGFAIVLLAANGITTARRLRLAIFTALASGVVAAALAALEYAGVPGVMRGLHAFHEGVSVVGGQLRASGTLQYPTIASMYLEIVFALGLGALLWSVDRRSAAGSVALLAALLMVAEGVIVTLTRTGLVTMAASLAVVALWRIRRPAAGRALAMLGLTAAGIVLLLVSSSSFESLRLRLTTEGQRDWYHAGFRTPATLNLSAGSLNSVEVTVINRGLVTWEPSAQPPFHLSYHWFDEQMHGVVGYDGVRTALPRAVPPGDALNTVMLVRAPKDAGRYRLGWDVVQEGRLWFSTEPGSRLALSTVVVTGTAATDESSRRFRNLPMPAPAVRVGRRTLWAAALRIAAAHPILGIGPDNYRLSYGPYAQIDRPDERITSNNMYLEVLTGMGIAGLAAFAWLLWRIAASIRRSRRTLDGATASLYAGVAAAAIAIALHGAVDSFLILTPTYLAISLVVGLAIAPTEWTGAIDPCA